MNAALEQVFPGRAAALRQLALETSFVGSEIEVAVDHVLRYGASIAVAIEVVRAADRLGYLSPVGFALMILESAGKLGTALQPKRRST